MPTFVRTMLLLTLFASSNLLAQTSQINWSQPPVVCPEDLAPQIKEAAVEGQAYLKDPQSSKDRELYLQAWLEANGATDLDEKIAMIYQATNDLDMPPFLLMGALLQESSLSDDGLIYDGGNYSCGIAQLSVAEWCQWAETLDDQKAQSIHWPKKQVEQYEKENSGDSFCDSGLAEPIIIKPFFDVGQKGNTFPRADQLPMEKYLEIPFEKVERGISTAKYDLKELQYLVARSFLGNCGKHQSAIFAKAFTLAYIYKTYVPGELKTIENYKPGENFQGKCGTKAKSRAYPLNTGWLLADTIYNAGAEIMNGLEKYKTVSWDHFNPDILMSTLYYVAHDALPADKNREAYYGGARHHITHVVNQISRHDLWQ